MVISDEMVSMESTLLLLIDLKKKRMEQIRNELKTLPEGSLYLTKSRGKTYFIHGLKSSRKGISSQEDMIYRLARKKYLTILLREQQSSMDAIRRTASQSRKGSRPSSAASSLETLLRKYGEAGLDILRITCSEEQYRWARDDYWSNPVEFSGDVYETYSGVRIRSKSEQAIGNELELRGIPYRYEPAVRLDVSWMTGVDHLSDGRHKRFYPDFVILTASGERIIWEHLGRVDLPSYRAHNMEKISAYRQSGIVDDAHLILTFEKDLQRLSDLHRIIDLRIMPYM